MNLLNRLRTKNGIRFRLVGSYFIVILSTISIFIITLLYLTRLYYLNNVESTLSVTLEASANFYNNTSYFEELYKEPDKIGYELSRQTSAQVQLLDMKGTVIYDSIHNLSYGKTLRDEDIKEAILSGEGKYYGTIPETNEKFLSMSKVLMWNNTSVGILRFTTSLADVYSFLDTFLMMLIYIGILIIVIVTVISLLLTNSIIRPIGKITDAATNMTTGNFHIQLEKHHDDELGTLTDIINYLAQEILNSQNLQNEFISSISHEIRTPLTSIKGWSFTLKNTEVFNQEELNDGLTIIEDETDRLITLVNELLDFSRIGTEEFKLNLSPIDINQLVSYVIKQMKPRADRLGLEIISEIDLSSAIVMGDENRLKQVFINILDNAFKFTPNTGVITIQTLVDKAFYITIKDTGCGIDEDSLKRVMNKFYKKNSKEGIGLGLSISNQIILKHEGNIAINSPQGNGTRVTIMLPLYDGN